MVDAEDGGVQIGQRVEVDQPGRDQRRAKVDAPRHLARKAPPT
jgi:hypothetical protein